MALLLALLTGIAPPIADCPAIVACLEAPSEVCGSDLDLEILADSIACAGYGTDEEKEILDIDY